MFDPDYSEEVDASPYGIPYVLASILNKPKIISILVTCLVLFGLWIYYSDYPGDAQGQAQDQAQNTSAPVQQALENTSDKSGYVGPEVCAGCHADTAKSWAMTIHRKTLFNKESSRKGCEGCHGPGGPHVAAGGDPTKIVRFKTLKPSQANDICLKCHKQSDLTLWHTGLHARAKLSCTNCHDPHSPGEKTLLNDIENGKLQLEGLTRAIDQAVIEGNIAAEGSEEKAAANEKVAQLKTERNALRDKLKGVETLYQRTAEPYVCYNCHKSQQVQSKMPSHHPIPEGKMSCSSCHSPHGGQISMLTQESVVDTCFRCHPEKVGPFTFDHPPVTEDCTTCHNPHGSVQNNLLMQQEPFVCLKCHSGSHSRGNALGNPVPFARFYTECTDCHNQIHGSDNHQAFHF